ncbi:YesL family protein [Sporofaciens musculi]|jgi:Predicted integral membrane protein|uniref:YesL family protein n=1 Tax=Sporofaciens musculi TaxID=2681861 RepID=UPI0025A2E64C|nr:DUF624 domain-containing protein [Sporofaciens musculi]
MNLFDMNGPLMYNLGKLANIFLCNVLFCLFSLPLFTIGAALSALFACMQAIWDEDEDDIMAKQFWNAFKQNFRQGTVLWLLCLLTFVFLGIYYFIVVSMTGTVGRVYRVSFFMMCLIFLFGFQYLFPLQARYRNSIKNTLKNAWLLSVAALPWTVLSILLVAGAVYLSFFMNPNGVSLAVFLWGTLGFGIIAYLNSIFFKKAFQMIDPEKLEAVHEAPSEALFIDEEHRIEKSRYGKAPKAKKKGWR